MMKKFVATVEEDENGDPIIPLPEEMLAELGWKEGDTLDWKKNDDGTYSLSKIEQTDETEWVLVEAVSMFRMRYMVQVPKGKKEYALDTVVCKEAKEFSQEHLDEIIVSHRVVTEDEAIDICNVDNQYLSSWTREKKIDTLFTKIGEKAEL
jgi:hypothetical protein